MVDSAERLTGPGDDMMKILLTNFGPYKPHISTVSASVTSIIFPSRVLAMDLDSDSGSTNVAFPLQQPYANTLLNHRGREMHCPSFLEDQLCHHKMCQQIGLHIFGRY
jgi:hypothetical protein